MARVSNCLSSDFPNYSISISVMCLAQWNGVTLRSPSHMMYETIDGEKLSTYATISIVASVQKRGTNSFNMIFISRRGYCSKNEAKELFHNDFHI